MTKLNITNKTIYKLKKNKNQSKKNVPKKRKHKKRKQKNGRSFRKRRRKYNIKNNSIKKYKKQRGGVGEIDKRTAKSKDDGKIIRQFVDQQNEKEKEIKTQQYELRQSKNGRIDENSAMYKITQKIIKLGGKLEDETTKLQKLDEYKTHVETKLKEQINEVKPLKKPIEERKKSIRNANTTIKSKTTEIGKLNSEKQLAERRRKDLQKRIDNAPEGQMVDSSDIGELQIKITRATEVVEKQTKKFTGEMHEFNKTLSAYFNKQIGFISRPQTEEVEITEGDYQPNADKPVNDDDKLQTKINKFKLQEPPKENYEANQVNYEANKKYYEDHKDIKLDEIVKLLTDEQKWISRTQKNIKKRLQKVNGDIKKKNKELEDQNKKDVKEEKEQQDKISKTEEEKEKIKENIRKKKEEMKQDVKEWQRTQDEATATMKQGENVFQKKIEEISKEDAYKNREIDVVRKEIEDAKKNLKTLKKPGRKATVQDKEQYKKDIKKKEEDLEVLNKEYNDIIKGVEDKVSKPRLMSFQSTKDKYKEDIEKEARKKKKKSVGRKGWAKAGLVASKVLHTKFVLPVLAPYISDDMVGDPDTLTEVQEEKAMEETENYRLILNTPYVSGTDDIQYARADKPTKPDYGKPFYNYYLKKTIKTEDKGELKIFEMIEQRKARYIKWLMMKESGETYIDDLTDNIKKFEVSSGLMRNTLKEKIITLTFLAYIISRTDEVYIHPLTENTTEEEKKEHEEELKASKFERAIKDLHKTTIDGKTLFELFCIYVPEYTNTIDKVLTQDVLNSVNKTEHDKVISIGEEDFLSDGLETFNTYKPNHSDCGVLDENEDNENYLNIGLSNFSNIDNLKKWVITEEEQEQANREKMKNEFDEAQVEMNNAKNKKEESLKKLSERIGKIIDNLKIEETGAKIVKMEQELKAIRTNVNGKKLERQEGHAKQLEEQKQKYEEEAKIAERNLAVKEGLIDEQKEEMRKKQEEIERLESDLEAQNEGLKTCTEGDAATRAGFESKKADLEGKINRMEEEREEMERKMNDLETAKEEAVKVQEEYKNKIIETEKKGELLRNDIESSRTPTEVTDKTLIDRAEDDEDNPVDAAFDAIEDDDGINLELDDEEPLMVFLSQKNGQLEVVTSKLPGDDISNWLMGSTSQDGAGK